MRVNVRARACACVRACACACVRHPHRVPAQARDSPRLRLRGAPGPLSRRAWRVALPKACGRGCASGSAIGRRRRAGAC